MPIPLPAEPGLTPDQFDEKAWRLLAQGFIGVDEAGRGPLAGPVYAAAVVLEPGHGIKGLRDSKKMTETARERAFEEIRLKARAYGVASAGVEQIEESNILAAALSAMREAVLGLNLGLPVLVDGNKLIPGLPNEQTALVKGDNRSASIAAASILAKVTRDRHMLEMHNRFPAYGFNEHKGYGTARHLAMLRLHGPCEIHRKTFKGVLA